MKEPYIWDYNIRIKTQEGTFDYEQETLDRIETIIEKHPNYEEISAKRVKKLVKTNERGKGNK